MSPPLHNDCPSHRVSTLSAFQTGWCWSCTALWSIRQPDCPVPHLGTGLHVSVLPSVSMYDRKCIAENSLRQTKDTHARAHTHTHTHTHNTPTYTNTYTHTRTHIHTHTHACSKIQVWVVSNKPMPCPIRCFIVVGVVEGKFRRNIQLGYRSHRPGCAGSSSSGSGPLSSGQLDIRCTKEVHSWSFLSLIIFLRHAFCSFFCIGFVSTSEWSAFVRFVVSRLLKAVSTCIRQIVILLLFIRCIISMTHFTVDNPTR